jgi:hypothetical protein
MTRRGQGRTFLYIANHSSPLLTEIDVEIGHETRPIEEALEQEPGGLTEIRMW